MSYINIFWIDEEILENNGIGDKLEISRYESPIDLKEPFYSTTSLDYLAETTHKVVTCNTETWIT